MLTQPEKKLIRELIAMWGCGKPHHKCDCESCERHYEIGETDQTVFASLESKVGYPETPDDSCKGDYLRDCAKDAMAEAAINSNKP